MSREVFTRSRFVLVLEDCTSLQLAYQKRQTPFEIGAGNTWHLQVGYKSAICPPFRPPVVLETHRCGISLDVRTAIVTG